VLPVEPLQQQVLEQELALLQQQVPLQAQGLVLEQELAQQLQLVHLVSL
jgi:hypothetical protein